MSHSIGGISQKAAEVHAPKATQQTKNTSAAKEAKESAAVEKAEGDFVSISSEGREAAGVAGKKG
jgi:hypothetical protein